MPPTTDVITDPASGSFRIRDRLRNARGLHLGHAVAILFAVEATITLVLVVALTPRALLPILLPVVTLSGPAAAISAGMIIRLAFWSRWQRDFPALPQSPDAVVKTCQSVTLGRAGRINNGIHLAADERALHLIPLWFMRAGGCGVVSIPWEAFTDVGPTKGRADMRRADMRRATVNGRSFAAPAWAMDLTTPAAA